MLGPAKPSPAALHRLDHEQVRHRLVVGQVADAVVFGLHRGHCAKGTQAIGTPESD